MVASQPKGDTMSTPPPGCRWFAITRKINGEIRTLRIAAPNLEAAKRIADARAQEAA
jgi:hypothetical protein